MKSATETRTEKLLEAITVNAISLIIEMQLLYINAQDRAAISFNNEEYYTQKGRAEALVTLWCKVFDVDYRTAEQQISDPAFINKTY